MPGILGAIGLPAQTQDLLEREFLRRFPDAQVEREGDIVVAGHAFGTAAAVHRTDDALVLGLDGEWSLYREATPSSVADLFRRGMVRQERLASETESVGNIALVDPAARAVHLVVDASGTFPLYFAEHRGGFVFSSFLRILGGAISSARDDVAILEFLRDGYTIGAKTPYEAVRRLLPGQVLRHELGGGRHVWEHSRAWAGQEEVGADDAAERAWAALNAALRRCLPPTDSALMMSGGWDSRTLLGGASTADIRLTGYSHGDMRGRELRLVERLCRTMTVACHLEPIDDRVLDLDRLRRGFDRTENVVFPHWHRAGRVLSEHGTACITAGVFGEILGGHYGPAMLSGTAGKIKSIAGALLGLRVGGVERGAVSPAEFLRIPGLGRHWYLREDYEAAMDRPLQRMNAAIESALGRLEARDGPGGLSLVEAFISEHRATQYINAQLLSCRASTDVALPFAGGELFPLSTGIPLEAKIHNRLNRRMLARHHPELLRAPMAATLVPAGAPLIVQEASRAARKAYETGRLTLSGLTRGRIARPRLGWVNFEFLRDGRALHVLVDDLRADMWDHETIRRRVDALAAGTHPEQCHPMFDQLSKVYTIDLLLR